MSANHMEIITMNPLSFESVRARIRENFPVKPPLARTKALIWVRETASSMVTSDNRFRITRSFEAGVPVYVAEACATSTSKAVPIGGRFENADQAKDAVAFRT